MNAHPAFISGATAFFATQGMMKFKLRCIFYGQAFEGLFPVVNDKIVKLLLVRVIGFNAIATQSSNKPLGQHP